MSRFTRPTESPPRGTPIWVWVIYALGLMAATVFLGSALFALGGYLASDEFAVGLDVSAPAIVLWGGLIVLAAGTWLWRRRARP